MAQLVMVIDDSPVIRKILEIALHRAAYEVISFPDGIEAWRWLNSTEARIPDLAIVDLTLPKMDGYQIIRLLKAHPAFARTIFVILSKRDGVLDRLKGRLVGAHIYLTKPFKTDQLVTMARAALEESLALGAGQGLARFPY